MHSGAVCSGEADRVTEITGPRVWETLRGWTSWHLCAAGSRRGGHWDGAGLLVREVVV